MTGQRLVAAVFVDTSAFFALANVAERNYRVAGSALSRFRDERRVLLTTNFVIAETHALLLVRLGHVLAAEFLRALDAST